MIVIVEGIDCTGKTTLIEELVKLTGFNVLKGSSFEHSQCSQAELLNKMIVLSTMDNIILDRYIYSNEVYAPEYDDFACLSDEERRFIEREIKGEAIIIYLHAELDVIKQRFNTRGEEYVSIDKVEKLKANYTESLSKVVDIPILSFDTGIMSTDVIAQEIIKYIK